MIGNRGTSRLHKYVTQNSHIIITIAGIAPSVHIYGHMRIPHDQLTEEEIAELGSDALVWDDSVS